VAAVVVGAAGGQQAAALGQGGQGAAQGGVVLGVPDLDAVDAGLQGLGQDPSRSPAASRPGWASTATPPALAARATASVMGTAGAAT
jgi:hypothetical protein